MAAPSDDCVTVRARIRRSRRAIDPEFDLPREVLASLVDRPPSSASTASAAAASSSSASRRSSSTSRNSSPNPAKDGGGAKAKDGGGDAGGGGGGTRPHPNGSDLGLGLGPGPCLLLTPVPPAFCRSLSRSRPDAAGRDALSLSQSARSSRRRHRSFGHPAVVGAGPPGHVRKHSTASSLCSSAHGRIPSFPGGALGLGASPSPGATAGAGGGIGGGGGYQSDGGGRGYCSDGTSGTGNGMVDVSLEDDGEGGCVGVEAAPEGKPPGGGRAAQGDPLADGCHSHPLLKPGLPKHPSAAPPGGHSLQQPQYASPVPFPRTASVASGVGSDAMSCSRGGRSRGSRGGSLSRSRKSRQGSMGGHLRMRSLGAASAFAAANGTPNSGGTSGSLVNGEDAEGEGTDGEAKEPGPLSIPLKDIISVDEEVPSRKRGSRSGGSDFFCSAASRDELAKEMNKESGGKKKGKPASSTPRNSSAAHQTYTSTLPATSASAGDKVPHRILLHTLSNGYVKLALDGANQHDLLLAWLKARLPPERVPQRDEQGNKKKKGGLGLGGGLRTMVLTPTKEAELCRRDKKDDEAKREGKSSEPTEGKGDSGEGGGAPPSQPTEVPAAPSADSVPTPSSSRNRPLDLARSESTRSRNDVDGLHSRAIRQRLREESTPFRRARDRLATWIGAVMECACCQDTTVAPLESVPSKGGDGKAAKVGFDASVGEARSRSPDSQKLRTKGVAGLSFEESSCESQSFDKSVGKEG
ncbi:hypothetical protein ACHAWF_011169 [Thalassiosira exigua]